MSQQPPQGPYQPSGPLPPNTGYQQPSGPQWPPQQQPPFYTQPNNYQHPTPGMMPPPPMPPGPPKKKLSRRTWIIIGVVVLILVIASAANANKGTATPTDAAPTATATTVFVNSQATATPIPTATPKPTPTHAPKLTTFQTFTGTGDKTTATFQTSGDWKIVWTATASSESEAFFGITVYGSDGSITDPGAANATIPAGQKGGDNTDEHTGAGSFYLKVFAGVPWTIMVQQVE